MLGRRKGEVCELHLEFEGAYSKTYSPMQAALSDVAFTQGGSLATSPKQPRADRQYPAPARAPWEAKLTIVPIQDVVFDDEATLAMGTAFDPACSSLRHSACVERLPKLVAARIVEAAKNGECDPIRLRSQAITGFRIDYVSMFAVSVGTPHDALPCFRKPVSSMTRTESSSAKVSNA